MSTFSCHSISKLGLQVSQRALNVTGHNVSNVDTVGYVRQQAINMEKRPADYGSYQIGTGVDIACVRQMRSIFLDNMYRRENSTLNYWQITQSTIEDIEAVTDALSDNGLGQLISEFFSGWEEVAKDPESIAARESLVEYGVSLADMVNQLSEQLEQIQKDLDTQIKSMVGEINTITAQVAELNKKILVNELGGNNANDYRDELNTLLDTLSGYVNINVSEDDSGMYRVSAGGVNIVSGTNAYRMACETNASNGAFTTVVWEKSGMEVKLKDGELLGLINARGDVNGDKGSVDNGSPVESGNEEEDVDKDSETYVFSGGSDNVIARLRTGLNILTNLMTRKINAMHRSGTGLDGSSGVDFFVKIDDTLPFEIGNIKVNPLLDDVNKIAASATGASGDGSNATEIVDFKETEYFRNDGLKMNVDDFYALIVNWVGSIGEEAEGSLKNQSTLLQQVSDKKDSLSSVSLDEEMANVLKYQHAYNANAQVMSIVDGMVDKIINAMGIVGR